MFLILSQIDIKCKFQLKKTKKRNINKQINKQKKFKHIFFSQQQNNRMSLAFYIKINSLSFVIFLIILSCDQNINNLMHILQLLTKELKQFFINLELNSFFINSNTYNKLADFLDNINMKKQKQQQQRPKQIYINRLKCDCVAQKHQLINNCLGCGKVVCAQQGEGPCLYCGHEVTRPDTNFIISTKDQELFPTLSPQQLSKVSQERSKAILHKDKLVERDRSTNITQNIIDEQMDFYDVTQNQWLDEQDRQKAIDRILQKQKYVQTQKFKTKITFDHLTGQFVREQFQFNEEEFKKEGRQFVQSKQQQQYNARMRKGKVNLDKRVLQNEKMKELCEDLLTKKTQTKQMPAFLAFSNKPKQNLTQFIIQQQEQTNVEPQKKIYVQKQMKK